MADIGVAGLGASQANREWEAGNQLSGLEGYKDLTPQQLAYLAGVENYDPNNPEHVARTQAWAIKETAAAKRLQADQALERGRNPSALVNTIGVDTSTNYKGRSADGQRVVAFGADPTRLNSADFSLRGAGGIDQRLQQVTETSALQAARAQGRTGIGSEFAGAAQLDPMRSNAQQSRGMLLNDLTSPGPSAAESLLRSGQDASARQALALARSSRGYGGGGGAMRQAAMQAAEGSNAVSSQVATLRAQEAQQRTANLAQFAGIDQGAVGQEQGFYGAAKSAQLAQAGQNDSYSLGQSGVQLQAQQQKAALSQAQQQARADQAKTQMAADVGVNLQNANFANYKDPLKDNTGAVAGAISGVAGAAAMAMSDRRAKTNIIPLSDDGAGAGTTEARNALMAASQASGDPIASAITNSTGAAMALKDRLSMGSMTQAEAEAAGRAANESSAAGQALRMKERESLGAMTQAERAAAADALRAARGYQYDYKDPNGPGMKPGTQVGPMAQDLEKTPVGRSLVSESPDGTKGIDTSRLSLVNAAATSESLNKIDALEAELLKLKQASATGQSTGSSDEAARKLWLKNAQSLGLGEMTAAERSQLRGF